MNLNSIRDALVEELTKLPIPGDQIVDVSNQEIEYSTGSRFPAPNDNRLKIGDIVKEISYELHDDELYISINHSLGILDKITNKSISTDDLQKISRKKKLERINSI